jgi:hypothetical protein
MIPVLELTTAEAVSANARRLRDVFYPPRQIAPTRVPSTEKHPANDSDLSATTRQDRGKFQGQNVSLETASNPAGVVDLAVLLFRFKQVPLAHRYGPAEDGEPIEITMATVRIEIMREFGLSRLDIMSERRTKDVVQPRQAAMYLIKKYTTHSLPAIGRFFGGKDHSTVLHACRKAEQLITDNPAFRAKIKAVEARLMGGVA